MSLPLKAPFIEDLSLPSLISKSPFLFKKTRPISGEHQEVSQPSTRLESSFTQHFIGLSATAHDDEAVVFEPLVIHSRHGEDCDILSSCGLSVSLHLRASIGVGKIGPCVLGHGFLPLHKVTSMETTCHFFRSGWHFHENDIK